MRDVATGRTVQDWTTVDEFAGGKFTRPGSVMTSTTVGTEVGGAGLAVDAKVTNSVGRSNMATVSKALNVGQMSTFTNVLGGTGSFLER